MKRRTKIGLAVVVLIGVSLWRPFREDYGAGADSVSWLPRETHNITYIRTFWYVKAEFDTEQRAFEKWCAKRRMPLHEVGDAEYHAIIRYWGFLERRGVTPTSTEPDEGEGDFQRMNQYTKVFRAGDLFYEERWSNGGGYTIGYDTKEKRGYYSYSHH